MNIFYQPGRTIRKLQSNGSGHGTALLVAGVFGFLTGMRFYVGSADNSPGWLLAGVICGIGLL
ncbi:MAG: hypothetical protein ACPGC0_00875, partial [Opitutales bacterium]